MSISYKNAGIELRSRFAFSFEIQEHIMCELVKKGKVLQCVLLCTCNRTELYFCGGSGSCDDVRNIFVKYSGIENKDISPYIMFFHGDSAIRHLFRVACGIDSMVIGEDEILGQTKKAYLTAKKLRCVSYELNMIFQSAFSCAKKIKTYTALSKTSVSVATLAANEAAKFKENVSVLVIGATGKIGNIVLKNLMSHKNVSISVTQREHNNIFETPSSVNLKIVDYSKRYVSISNADCIISATSSPHFTVTRSGLEAYVSDKKERLFIDLAVPPDIEYAIDCLENVKLIGIDYFKDIAKENNELKLNSVDAAEEIISQEMEELKKELSFHDFLIYSENVKEKISHISFDDILYKLKSNLNSEQLSAVLKVFQTLGGKQ